MGSNGVAHPRVALLPPTEVTLVNGRCAEHKPGN
jgi:hypothetical protein